MTEETAKCDSMNYAIWSGRLVSEFSENPQKENGKVPTLINADKQHGVLITNDNCN